VLTEIVPFVLPVAILLTPLLLNVVPDNVIPLLPVYVVLVGITHVPSPRKNDVCLPAAGAGTRPALPAALAVAAVILEYVVFVVGGVYPNAVVT
jgi:hypothetical protein